MKMGLKNLLKIYKQQTHNPSREALANAFSLPAAQKRRLG